MNEKTVKRLTQNLTDVSRCPHCGIAYPQLVRLWHSDSHLPRSTPGPVSRWAIYRCTSCGDVISAKGIAGGPNVDDLVVAIFPEPKQAHEDIPEIARRFLQQAYETLHAPDAAAVMAGSAVDAMLKQLGLSEGSLYARIDQAVQNHILTQDMGEWAHEVRLGSNRPRHADEKNPHLTPDEAIQSVEFAEALANFLFVLKAKITRGIEQAKKTVGETTPSK